MTISWGAVCRAKQGQLVSGDVYLVTEQAENDVLAAVIDGLGGGAEAERAARLAAQTIEQHSEYPLQELIRRSHTALHSTRGAVIGLLRWIWLVAALPMLVSAILACRSTAASRSSQSPKMASWDFACPPYSSCAMCMIQVMYSFFIAMAFPPTSHKTPRLT